MNPSAMNQSADYIVVGAGSAGCALAAKLSESGKHSVLLIESGGPDASAMIEMPRGIGTKDLIMGGRFVWDYKAETAPGYGEEPWYTGKTLGGSSSINGMVYVRGHPEDYNGWEREGCAGWGWDSIGPCFVDLEQHELGASEWRGAKGPLKVSLQPRLNDLCDALLDAGAQAGVPRVADVNLAWDGGFGYQPRNIHRGRRQSAAKIFLREAEKRKNVEVLTGSSVRRIVFEGRRAVGVEVQNAQGVRTVKARREIILTAGALHSPQLLQLSGIGPAKLLASLGIPIIVDAPLVGENLRDHRYLSVQYLVRQGSLNRQFQGLKLLVNVARYFLSGTGVMTHAAHELVGFARTRPGLARPDSQIGIGLYSFEVPKTSMRLDKVHGITFCGYHTQPKSQGTVRLRANDLAAPLDIHANYLTAPEDRVASIALARFSRHMAAQPALAPYILEENLPGSTVQTDEEIVEAYLRQGGTSFHYAGTCRMGADDASVVDPQLRVRGVEGLRVADASIMPTLVSGNTNAPTMVIGMRAAQLILGATQATFPRQAGATPQLASVSP